VRGLGLILTAVLSLLVAPAATRAQQAKVWRIGVLLVGLSRAEDPPRAFQEGLRELGYVEGKNIAIEWRDAAGSYDRLVGLAAELVRLKVDVIVTESTVATRAAKQATTATPIVMTNIADPVGSGLVTSLARPGGNITGLTVMSPELAAKRLELLKEAVSKVARVAVLWNPGTPFSKTMLNEVEGAAPSLRLRLQSIAVRGPDELEHAFSTATRGRADALFVIDDPMFGAARMRLLDLGARSRLPATYGTRVYVNAGGLMSYGPNWADLFRRAAGFVDKILKGAKPADLPVEQPVRFELVINLKTAKALGLTIPQSVLLRADEVIK
jgi:putative tryptophan/tyrosine transport system substrate-binding protein